MVSAKDRSTHGYLDSEWDQAKEEAKAALRKIARKQGTISYADLITKIDAIKFEPNAKEYLDFLGQISLDEDDAGRGMLTAIVTHPEGARMPGPGFFDLAAYLGRKTADRATFWSDELKRVYLANKR